MARTVSKVPRPELRPAAMDTLARGVVIANATELGQVVRWVRGERRLPREAAAARAGVSRDVLRHLESATRGVNLTHALDVLSSCGIDVVLVPRDRSLTLRDPRDFPSAP